ncbi:amino acid ABC transporter permease [Alicycliphilus denitrificans]|uniref:Amino acid ABC transporter permease n=1 Tax=Alicycliphilus denitrificans TaxID=179636 RepID=A0A858ZRW7_9BURK|nr:amino acid ABC transporter permease [Alicycliphilus denitrificans]QKD43578.1 amino acid ABC transporter permease [Alicycliphilus denitrificans]
MNYSWNWMVLLEPSPTGEGSYLWLLVTGLKWTVATALSAWAVAVIFGTIVGIARTWPLKLAQTASKVYVTVFRNLPLIVQLFIWYFLFPELLPKELAAQVKQLEYGPFYTAVWAIGLSMSARVAEQVRSGIQAIAVGQVGAGLALGFTTGQLYRYVLLPQSFRYIVPTLTTDFTTTVKATSVALTIGLAELTAQANAVQEYSFQVFEAFTAATILYVGVNGVVAVLMRWLEKVLEVPGMSIGK